jgi:hypothetical protein
VKDTNERKESETLERIMAPLTITNLSGTKFLFEPTCAAVRRDSHGKTLPSTADGNLIHVFQSF